MVDRIVARSEFVVHKRTEECSRTVPQRRAAVWDNDCICDTTSRTDHDFAVGTVVVLLVDTCCRILVEHVVAVRHMLVPAQRRLDSGRSFRCQGADDGQQSSSC